MEEELQRIFKSGTKDELMAFCQTHDLVIENGKIKSNNKDLNKKQIEHWHNRQHSKKILLNSLYGALLNIVCRFFLNAIGQSTTLSGRKVSKHMSSKVNEVITGNYDHTGESIIYGDTDSVFFSVYPMVKNDVLSGKLKWDKDSVIQLYDDIAQQANSTFLEFMQTDFNCPADRATVIKADREIVGELAYSLLKKDMLS